MKQKQVGIIVFDEIEVLDFCGPFEVLTTTRLDEGSRRENSSPFQVSLISQFDNPVTTAGGMKVIPDHTFDTCPMIDIMIIPGGLGSRREMHNRDMLAFIAIHAKTVEILASVCTGALILANTGLLDGLRVTTHWRALEMMQRDFPNTIVESAPHVVKSGKIMTSAGISAGIDLALQIVGECFGEAVARATARHMEYPFFKTNQRRITL